MMGRVSVCAAFLVKTERFSLLIRFPLLLEATGPEARGTYLLTPELGGQKPLINKYHPCEAGRRPPMTQQLQEPNNQQLEDGTGEL